MLSFKDKRLMVVAAHPDDELLGLGATMHRLIREYGVNAHVVILGEGITSRSGQRNKVKWKKEVDQIRNNIFSAQKAIGYHSVSIHDFPDNRFDTVALLDIIKIIEKEKDAFHPELVFTHHGGDLNIDHQLTFQAVTTACRPLKEEKVKTIITFETPSSTEWIAQTDTKHFKPNLFFEVMEEDIAAKIKGMECYGSEIRSYPHPRSHEALMIMAQQRGITVGCDYAEAFCLIRSINNSCQNK